MRKKSLFQYAILAFFIMCMGLSTMKALDYTTQAGQWQYLQQGLWLLGCTCIAVLFFGIVRLEKRLTAHLPTHLKLVVEIVIVALAIISGFALRFLMLAVLPLNETASIQNSYEIAVHLVNDTLLSRDASAYRQYIAQFPSALGYPMFIVAPLFSLFGTSAFVMQCSNVFFGMACVVLCYLIARRLTGRLGGVLCVLFLSFWPSQILSSALLTSEPSFAFLILLGAYLVFRAMERDERSLYATSPNVPVIFLGIAGIVFGFAVSIRPIAFFIVLALCIVMLGINRVSKSHTDRASHQVLGRGWMCAVILLIFYVLTSVIITQRVSEVVGEDVASGLNISGYHLMVSTNVDANGMVNETDSAFFDEVYRVTGSANEAHAQCYEVALERISEDPLGVVNLFFYQFCNLWQSDDFAIDLGLTYAQDQGILTNELSAWLESLRPISQLMYMSLLLLCFLGALQLIKSHLQSPMLPLTCVLFFLGTALSYIFGDAQALYHYSMTPFLLLLGVTTIASWRYHIKEAPPERIIQQILPPEQLDEAEDRTRFDIGKAIREGHVIVSATKAYETPAPADEVPAPVVNPAPIPVPVTPSVDMPTPIDPPVTPVVLVSDAPLSFPPLPSRAQAPLPKRMSETPATAQPVAFSILPTQADEAMEQTRRDRSRSTWHIIEPTHSLPEDAEKANDRYLRQAVARRRSLKHQKPQEVSCEKTQT